MSTPVIPFMSSNERATGSFNVSCDNCLVGYCCCFRSRFNVPSKPYLSDSFATNVSSPFIQENRISIEYKEPEENFVSIEDVKIKKLLTKIGQQQQKIDKQSFIESQFSEHRNSKNTYFSRPVIYEIIELDDEEERKKLKLIKQQAEKNCVQSIPELTQTERQTKCLDISLIPKYSHTYSHTSTEDSSSLKNSIPTSEDPRVVAKIDLIDSSSSESSNLNKNNYLGNFNQSDEESFSLASSVHCELLCDESNNVCCKSPSNQKMERNFKKLERTYNNVISLESENEIDKKGQSNLFNRWEEYTDRGKRVYFECFLCGKKVQSSYNLRRHMMIHTGERPFNCDLCNRKFREFSDLKKHRRRHAGEIKFLCMVCNEYPPTDNDSTRCIHCCAQTKSTVIIAASRVKRSYTPSISETSDNGAENRYNDTTRKKITCVLPNFIEKEYRVVQHDQYINELKKKKRFVSQTGLELRHLIDNLPVVHRPGFCQFSHAPRKEFPCPLCNRPFGSRHNLKRHYMIHTGEKPFSCNECRKPFREYSTLKKHMVTHQRDRWYKCLRCSQKFRDFLQYSEHKRLHLISIRDLCQANNSMKYKSTLRTKNSPSEDDFSSDECAQPLINMENYSNHLKQHDPNVY